MEQIKNEENIGSLLVARAGFEPASTAPKAYLNSQRDPVISFNQYKDLSDREAILNNLGDFCRVDLQRAPRTTMEHVRQIKRFLIEVEGLNGVSRDDIREYLKKFSHLSCYTYANVLKSLKIFFCDFLGRGDIVDSFKFPSIQEEPTLTPSKEEMKRFYEALGDPVDRTLILFSASSGLRLNEILTLRLDDVDQVERMIIPQKRFGSKTKRIWASFFNNEAQEALRKYILNREDKDQKLFDISYATLRRHWKKVVEKTGVNITSQILRKWFSSEMGRLGVPDRYIDAFQGRIPKSVLARRYTDYSPERLKEIYDKVGLKILSK